MTAMQLAFDFNPAPAGFPIGTPVANEQEEFGDVVRRTPVMFWTGNDRTPRAFMVTELPDHVRIDDIDNDVTVNARMFPESRINRTMIHDIIQGLDARAFMAYVSNHKTYTGKLPEAEAGENSFRPGSKALQMATGLSAKPIVDIRTPELVAMADNPASGYELPPVTREDAIGEIMAHAAAGPDGFGVSWKVTPGPKFSTNGAPTSRDMEEIDPRYNADWAEHLSENPEIVEGAINSVIEPFIDKENFEVKRTLDEDYPTVSFMMLKDEENLRSRLEGMPDAELATTWADMRMARKDFSVPQVRGAMQLWLNEARSNFDRDMDEMEADRPSRGRGMDMD